MTAGAPTPEELELKRLALQQDGCVAFLGAGISIPPAKDWTDTVREIGRRCGVTIGAGKLLPEVIDDCMDRNEAACDAACRQLFPQFAAASRQALSLLLRLPFKAVLTVNFDPWLHQQSQQDRYKRIHVYPDLPLTSGLLNGIYYLHGYFNSGDSTASVRNLVFGERSFRQAYTGSLLPGFLLNVFTYESVLFVGVDPTERHLARLLEHSVVVRRSVVTGRGLASHPVKHYALWPAPVSSSQENEPRRTR